MYIRPNYAEGKFYSSKKEEVIQIIENAVRQEKDKIDYTLINSNIIGGVVPHAGHIYSAPQAIHFFEIVKDSGQEFDVVIIVNPNHHGAGLPASIDEHDYWQSPLGVIQVDKELASYVGLPEDKVSQEFEHSGEVIIPYIQYFMPEGIKILPVSFGAQNRENAHALGHALFKACKVLNKKPLFIASSDFNHFASADIGRQLDDYALEALMKYDCAEFEKRVKEKNISICGFGTIMTLFYFAKDMYEHFNIKILRQGHSGEVAQMDQVVDYVSMMFYTER